VRLLRRWARSAAALGAAATAALIGVSYAEVEWLRSGGRNLWTNAPPLTGAYEWRFSAATLPAIGVGVAGIAAAPDVARDMPWRRLLLASAGAALVWATALALVDGRSGFLSSTSQIVDYRRTVPQIVSVGAFLHGFVAHIHSYAGHVRSHPPGLVLLLWEMNRAGLGSAWWEAALELGAGAASVPAVLIVLCQTLGEQRARAAAPFLSLAPAAVFWGSGDAVFLAVGAWATALLVLATKERGRRSRGLALAGGVAFGFLFYLSYGLVLLVLLPIAITKGRRRRLRTLLLGAVGVALVWSVFQAAGFGWLSGLVAARREVSESVQRLRPYGLFLLVNLAAFAFALGPAVWGAIGRFLAGSHRQHDPAVWRLAGTALLIVAIADLTGLSKGEAERIWLPFAPWIVALTGVVFEGSERRRWLAAQVMWALLVQSAVRSPW
jgi:hypothetical protein